MTDDQSEQLLADCLENFHRRRALGEKPRPDDYRERLGADYDEFLGILAAESALHELIEQESEGGLPRVFGDYTLLRILGRGAMGVVYEAVHRPLGRKVALKILRTGFDLEPEAIERFRREARACAQVKHDHIVDIYEAGKVEDKPYYAMELLEGQSLADMIRAGDMPDPKALCRGLAGVADALEVLHRGGIIHRDVKPANILVQPDGRMILADFGLARTIASDRLTQTGQVLGTPLYMSPEQFLARREEIDDRTDVYGLGVTMYEVFAGFPPFSAPDSLALMRMILHERPVPLSEAAPDIPLPLAFLVMKAMENRQEDRYQTAAEMREDLTAFAEDRPVVGRPVSATKYALRRLRRWLPLVAAAALLLAVGLWFWSNRDGELIVKCTPVARVFLDGRLLGDTEVRRDLDPGEYDLLMEREGFESKPKSVTLRPGQGLELDLELRILEPEDAQALTVLGDGLGVNMEPLPAPERHRGGVERPYARMLLPRGRVLLDDLAAVSLDGAFLSVADGDEIRIFRDRELLGTLPVNPASAAAPIPVPPEILARLSPGETVRFEYMPASGGPPRVQEATLVSPPARLAEVGKRIDEQPQSVQDLVIARLYLSEELYASAWRMARESPDSVLAMEVGLAALSALDLKDTDLYAVAVADWEESKRR